jgi:formate-dependent phosphoribosylglycinamide formyltransferase (GAR transformylase)
MQYSAPKITGMRHIVFIAPFPAETTLRFLRALSSLADVHVTGIVHTPPGGADAALFRDVARVDKPLDVGHLRNALRVLVKRHGRPHRIVGLLEPIQVAIAQLREELGVKGTNAGTAELFRDKSKMKDALRAAGLPCARHRLLRSWQDAAAFVDEVGVPLVLKPPDGMGCKSTWRIRSVEQLREALETLRPDAARPLLAEEMIRGTEHSLETITVGGKVMLSSTTNYHPTPLEVVENPWIQWVVIAPRRVDGPELAEVHALGRRAVEVLGLESGMTHMEWFRRDDGLLAIGEIAARPPGANMARLTGLAYDTSMYRAWARAVVDDAFDGPWERKFASGAAFLRGMGRGRVVAVHGVAQVNSAIGEHVVEAQLPARGAPKSDLNEGDGFVLVRHPDTAVVEQCMSAVLDTVRVYYG